MQTLVLKIEFKSIILYSDLTFKMQTFNFPEPTAAVSAPSDQTSKKKKDESGSGGFYAFGKNTKSKIASISKKEQ